MNVPAPHFLLFSESRQRRKDADLETEQDTESVVGHWRFVLESIDGEETFEADDEEPLAHGERLELLAVVRGLEALDQPSRVTLVTPSRYVSRGLRFGLEQWRESGWLWESFGRMAPVKNRDLWQRVDRALEFHKVECRTWQFEQEASAAQEEVVDDSDSRLDVEAVQEQAAEVEQAAPEVQPTQCLAPSARQEHSPPTNSRLRERRMDRRNRTSGLPSFCRRLVERVRQAIAPQPIRVRHEESRLAGPHF